MTEEAIDVFKEWQKDWCKFARDVLRVNLDVEQQAILRAVQTHRRVSVCSGTARGKDFIAAVACVCFMYLTPKFNDEGELVENTKVAMTAPCYDDQTEILTDSGWKLFKDLHPKDLVAQLGEGNTIEFVKPLDYIIEPYIGEMIGFKNKMVDFLVTPNHRCLFDFASFDETRAKEIHSFHELKKAESGGKWTQYDTARELGIPQPNISRYLRVATKGVFVGKVRKAKDIYGKNGRFLKEAVWNGGQENDLDWFEFLGFWFAEGTAQYNKKSRKYRVTLTQYDDPYVDDLIYRNRKRFRNKFHKYPKRHGGFNWELYQIEIAKELSKYGTSRTKKIPSYIKNADVNSLKAFIKGFLEGDGSIDCNGSVKLCTSSFDMANDLHEMCVKAGIISAMKAYEVDDRTVHHDKDWKITHARKNGKRRINYEIKICMKYGSYPKAQKKDWYKEDYKGFVYCVKVPTGMVMVRRNGLNHWSGNTDRQVGNIMFPEVSRLVKRAKVLPGRLVGYDIRTDWEEWFLTGFKASKDNHEAWSGFHAANTMFVVTEASGIDQSIFDAIEGNLQGNSRLLIVFNPNITTGYAAQSQKQARWKKFRLDSLSSPNVIEKKVIIPGQVDYEWVKDKVQSWCTPISEANFTKGEGGFEFEGRFYRPNDLFRVKVRGMFPKVSEDTLIPLHWIEAAQENWKNAKPRDPNTPLRVGQDVAGMGRDNSIACYRYNNYVEKFDIVGQAGQADHMVVAGHLAHLLRYPNNKAFIDTIGEGAGVYSRLVELGYNNAFSAKFSESATDLTDVTGVYRFANMRAYCYWALRDWLNPVNGNNPCLPPCDQLTEELTEIKWKFRSDGSVIIEAKEDIKKRLKRSTDYSDALAETFYPHDTVVQEQDLSGVFF